MIITTFQIRSEMESPKVNHVTTISGDVTVDVELTDNESDKNELSMSTTTTSDGGDKTTSDEMEEETNCIYAMQKAKIPVTFLHQFSCYACLTLVGKNATFNGVCLSQNETIKTNCKRIICL